MTVDHAAYQRMLYERAVTGLREQESLYNAIVKGLGLEDAEEKMLMRVVLAGAVTHDTRIIARRVGRPEKEIAAIKRRMIESRYWLVKKEGARRILQLGITSGSDDDEITAIEFNLAICVAKGWMTRTFDDAKQNPHTTNHSGESS